MANAVARKTPYSLEAEQSVLGCILLSQSVAGELCSSLAKDDFYSPVHQQIFAAMQEIVNKNQPVDYVTLVSELEKEQKLNEVGGINYITTLTNIVPTAANYDHYVNILLENSKLRKLLDMGQSVAAKAYDGVAAKEIMEYVEKQITDIATNQKRLACNILQNQQMLLFKNFKILHKIQMLSQASKLDFMAWIKYSMVDFIKATWCFWLQDQVLVKQHSQ